MALIGRRIGAGEGRGYSHWPFTAVNLKHAEGRQAAAEGQARTPTASTVCAGPTIEKNGEAEDFL